jgi:hypothetical protein
MELAADELKSLEGAVDAAVSAPPVRPMSCGLGSARRR